MVEFQKAILNDARTIVITRQKVWNATYRGIYPDTAIDDFDVEWHQTAEEKRLSDPHYCCYMVTHELSCVGYYAYGPTKKGFRLHSLYLLPPYQKCGLGRRIFEQVINACLDAGFDKMFLDCHPKNYSALGFYKHMGGIVAHTDTGHANPMEDSCTILFDI